MPKSVKKKRTGSLKYSGVDGIPTSLTAKNSSGKSFTSTKLLRTNIGDSGIKAYNKGMSKEASFMRFNSGTVKADTMTPSTSKAYAKDLKKLQRSFKPKGTAGNMQRAKKKK